MSDSKQLQKLVNKPNFNSRTIYDETLALVILNKTCVVLNKPIYVGVTILELAKLHMFEFHYGEMLPL